MFHLNSLGRESYFVAHRFVIFSILFILLEISCNNNSITNVERISGNYEATTFIESGQHDGGVDILANGGRFTALLNSNFEVEVRLVIPGNIGSNFAPTGTNYSGTFTVDEDTVSFKNTNTFLDGDPIIFIANDTRLETPNLTGWLAPLKIILEKQ